MGAYAGGKITTGVNNIAFGNNSGTTGASPSGLINLTTNSHTIVMGNSSHTTACIQISWGVASDIRDKCVYGNVPHGRDFLRGVNPIKYSFKDRETNEVTDDRVRYGFSAQEILELEGEENIIAQDKNPDKLGLTHDYLIPVLVNAVKELDQENQELKAEIAAIKAHIGITTST